MGLRVMYNIRCDGDRLPVPLRPTDCEHATVGIFPDSKDAEEYAKRCDWTVQRAAERVHDLWFCPPCSHAYEQANKDPREEQGS